MSRRYATIATSGAKTRRSSDNQTNSTEHLRELLSDFLQINRTFVVLPLSFSMVGHRPSLLAHRLVSVQQTVRQPGYSPISKQHHCPERESMQKQENGI